MAEDRMTSAADGEPDGGARPGVAVIGATGFLGQRVVSALLRKGARVTAAARHPDAGPDAPPGAALRRVAADIGDAGSLERALAGCSATVNCVALYREQRGRTFEDVHVHGARRWAQTAAAAGAARAVLVSGIGADPASDDAYVRARGEGEAAVREAFPGVTIVRPSAMFSRDGAFFGALAAILRPLPAVPMFGDGSTRLQPVSVDDVAEAIATIATARDAPEPLYEFGGPNVYTFREILERLAAKEGRRRWLVPLPFAVWQALAAAGRVLPAAPVTPGQVALMRKDNVVGQGVGTFADLGIAPRPAEQLGLI